MTHSMKVKKWRLEKYNLLFTYIMSETWDGFYLVFAFSCLHRTNFSPPVPPFGLKFGQMQQNQIARNLQNPVQQKIMKN